MPAATATIDAACRAIQDPTRRAILDALRARQRSAGEIAELFPISRPAVSKHLRVLRRARLVAESREGRNRMYRLEPRPLAALDRWLEQYRAFWSARLTDLKQLAEHLERAERESPDDP
jgi:DNA-binding transcriptional ArsR family regulator